MAATQLINGKALRRLRRPKLRSIRRIANQTVGSHTLDRVANRRCSNQRRAVLHHSCTAIKQLRFSQTTGAVMNQDVAGLLGQPRQTTKH